MRYESLVRQLVEVSHESFLLKKNIEDRISHRCLPSTDLVRRTLMNTVCDPRYKIYIGSDSIDKGAAYAALMKFANEMIRVHPDESEAEVMMNNFLSSLMRDFWKENHQTKLFFEPGSKSHEYPFLANEALNIICPMDGSSEMTTQEIDGMLAGLGTGNGLGNDSQNSISGKSQDNSQNTNKNESGSRNMGIGGGPGAERAIENLFLNKVPPALLELVKQIGRVGDADLITQGSFSVASKSDISGIMVGNDLSCVLPNELAILSDRDTESIFYHRYATRRLQIFASQSGSVKGKKRKDGPIIICLDASSSMSGEPLAVATALTMAICVIAKRKHRPVLIDKYSDSSTIFPVRKFHAQKRELMRFLSFAEEGGNNEDGMFRSLFSEQSPVPQEWETADVLCISDFGWAEISDEVVDTIKAKKNKGMKFYGLNIGEFWGANTDYSLLADTPGAICDSMWEYHHGFCKEIKDWPHIISSLKN